MTTEAWIARFNARAEELELPQRIIGRTEGERASALKISEKVSAVYGEGYLQVIAAYDGASVAEALVVYSIGLDVEMGVNPKVRNDWLRRLHLFDGRLADGRPKRTEARGYVLTILPGNPSRQLFSLILKKKGESPEA